jgi:hypothetical protein
MDSNTVCVIIHWLGNWVYKYAYFGRQSNTTPVGWPRIEDVQANAARIPVNALLNEQELIYKN